jgi:hypothetical protein
MTTSTSNGGSIKVSNGGVHIDFFGHNAKIKKVGICLESAHCPMRIGPVPSVCLGFLFCSTDERYWARLFKHTRTPTNGPSYC